MKRMVFLWGILILISLFSVCYAEDIAGEYVVKIKDGAQIDSVSREILEPIAEEWDIYKVSEEDMEKLNMENVEYAEPNFTLELMETYPNDPFYTSNQSTFMNMIKAPYAWNKNIFGSGVRVAVIDSGVNINHPDLKNRIAQAIDFTGSENPAEEYAHGSYVAGALGAEINNGIGIAGVSQADIYMLKVFKGNTTSWDMVIAAFSAAVNDYQCDIINLSFGGELTADEIMLFDDAIGEIYQQGVIVVAAAGNSGNKGNPVFYPAACEHVISVAAVNSTEAAASFSEYNDMIDVAAPGVSVYTTNGMYTSDSDLYKSISGTSISSPVVAGAVAMVKGVRPETDQDDIELLLKYSSRDAGTYGYDVHYGWGILDIEKLVKMASGEGASLYPLYPSYDADASTIEISYLNTGEVRQNQPTLRVVVYDEEGKLSYISAEQSIDIASYAEDTYLFENIDIPEGGYVKIFCMSDWTSLIPAADTAMYN